jgi:predicted  nucleic acid-binding Zn ribbon protein
LGRRYHSAVGKEMLTKVVAAFGAKPTLKMLDDEARRRQLTWKGSLFLYLFTHAFDWTSPVCRGDGQGPIPVFLIPITFQQKEEVYRWQRRYRLYDDVWLECGSLEIPAYRKLAEANSDLTQEGQELCCAIEKTTGVPTFYYLMRYWGRATGEHERLCPRCGGRWTTANAVEERRRFWHFDFKCDRCRLVSHRGVSSDGGRHTKIGEFRRKGK